MTWLADHLATLRTEAARRSAQELERLRAEVRSLSPAREFRGNLQVGPAVIAEIKFRSPSAGWLRPARDVERVAEAYHRAGAAAMSVLVDEAHFGGELGFLARARAACPLPLLAKGFFVAPVQLWEARQAGADAALLIAKALVRGELETMLEAAREAGLATLLEVHDEADLAKIKGLALDGIGVNHRDLDTLALDLDLSARLAPRLPGCGFRVAESGLATGADLRRMAGLGYGAVLVGTAFMTQVDPGEGLARLLEDCHGGH